MFYIVRGANVATAQRWNNMYGHSILRRNVGGLLCLEYIGNRIFTFFFRIVSCTHIVSCSHPPRPPHHSPTPLSLVVVYISWLDSYFSIFYITRGKIPGKTMKSDSTSENSRRQQDETTRAVFAFARSPFFHFPSISRRNVSKKHFTFSHSIVL